MKIVFDHQIFRAQQYGGVSRYFYEVAKQLSADKNCDVEIFAPLYVNEYLGMASNVRIRGKKIKSVPYSAYLRKGINNALTRMMVTPRKEIDIFHETFFTQLDNRPHSAKGLVTVYDMIHEKFPDFFPARSNFQKRKACAVKRADHVICISENTRQDLIELLDVPEEKTSVVYLGHSLSRPIEAITPENSEKSFILYVGNRDGYKNYELMLRAYASSKSLKSEISIICFGGGSVTTRERDLMASLNLPPDCVKYMGGDDSILASLYASAKVFVYPSLYEGFGIPPLEAMAFGCPVVCANTSSIPEVVGDAAELFNPESESELRAAMEKVVFSQEHAARLVAKGHERIKLFSWEKCAMDTLAVYEKILGK